MPPMSNDYTRRTDFLPPTPTKNTLYSNDSRSSVELRNRTGGGMAGMLDTDRSRTRRERTFVGSECAVCEEPLEHMLRGERILQFSCGHVSHEACFYEYIKEFESQYCPTCNAPLGLDTSRGGNVLDIEKLSSIVRSVSASDHQSVRSQQTPTPTAWDSQTVRPPSREANARQPLRDNRDSSRDSRDSNNRDSNIGSSKDSRESRERAGRYAASSRISHTRNDSEMTGPASSVGYPETAVSGPPRRHDYDVQSMETNLMSPRASITRNPIPPPSVSVRSEFPTLNRSRQQQTLTCLITIEVADNKWRPDTDDLRSANPQSHIRPEDTYARPPSPAQSAPRFYPYEQPEVLEEITENLRSRVDNWHGLDFERFGKLRLYGTIRVGKDKKSWQELECYLFAEMLICVKEKKVTIPQQWDDQNSPRKQTRCTLKGSILIRKHLNEVTESGSGKSSLGQTEKITMSNLRPAEENVLTLSLSVAELPSFHLRFDNKNQLKLWQQALLDLNAVEGSPVRSPEYDLSETDEEDWQRVTDPKRVSSLNSSYGGPRSVTTAPTEYTNARGMRLPAAIHVPIDIVVVIPVSSSMQGVKMSLVRDALKFLVQNLGERDRMGFVTFGSSGGAAPLVGMTSRAWNGWSNILASIRPVGQKSHRADVVDGANIAMDLLMSRKSSNPIATILLISDSSTSDTEGVDFVVSRAEAAKIAIHSFGLGMTHKPDTMIELSTRTKASYTYVKDWMMLRECLAGCMGALQSMSHQNVKLKLRLPEGSPAKFVKISGALQITKRATGRDAEAFLGDLRFGDKRDILVQLVIAPDNASQEQLPQDPWESIVSGLEALGGSLDKEDERVVSIEEVPLIQADLTWGDVLRDGTLTHLPRPSLLAITMLPTPTSQQQRKSAWPNTPPIPPHPSVVQRRMELLTSDMLTRALTLVSRGQHDRAQHLLHETRSILKGLGKGGLPPIPPLPHAKSPGALDTSSPTSATSDRRRTPSPPTSAHTTNGSIHRHHSSDALSMGSSPGIDAATVAALDAELEASLEWINHPAVFGRDSRKAVLQAIGVISSQRGYTFRSPVESLWARRVGGVKKLTERSREWREESGSDVGIMEES
ncbi:related to von Willebrand and RING finger domain protein [Rhynchosporium agropyri]|uniref:Related to von Willebrand and RING finger domain protein n=1 Tax=Rhynchosporium agropyri TaxID=914238 RepID=A0A1E1K567_9HELO|nr:related to von Willebrand and RING finger domain protein [Rhynchosporium agropyri]